MTNTLQASIQTSPEFSNRHIGPRSEDEKSMLSTLGFSTLEEMATKVIPKTIRSSHHFTRLGEGLSEFEALHHMHEMMRKNKIHKSYIGLGFHDTITPPVIQRNILENPVWYTAYTPYQPEISQGRLEALLNFQTMVMDLTGMEISNSSLLDEGSAAAEAMVMAHSLAKNKSSTIWVSDKLHPHVLEVLATRAEPLGLTIKILDLETANFGEPLFAVMMAYPDTDGNVQSGQSLADKAHQVGALLIADVDLLALTVCSPPGEWGADIVIGNSQRFGVPLGAGGPHAAFLATKDAYKRLMPGRLVGVSIDSQNQKALRLTLQTREQHIRREKATSNICTAQVLLANMASMYAVYHGPEGLKKIAQRVHTLTQVLAKGLEKLGFTVQSKSYFDTLLVETPKSQEICSAATSMGMNFRLKDSNHLTLSLNETTNLSDIEQIWVAFRQGNKPPFLAPEILKSVSTLALSAGLERSSKFLTHPVFNTHHSEAELTRYIHSLQNKDLTLTHSMIPLGSCTMKLNATSELMPVSWPEVGRLHPFAPMSQLEGYQAMIKDLEEKLCDITGFAAVSVQPNAGSQGEYAGLLVIRKYHLSRNQGHRTICLIPSSAHGTNPASAVMAGMDVVVVACDEQGNIDVQDLKAKAIAHKDKLAALMITYPSTHGVFEESVSDICKIIHDNGGQVYMDGANLNALVGLCRPGEFGPDVSHMNLHKTFAIPHGGGGPGVGPIGVAAHLKNFLPTHSAQPSIGKSGGVTATTSGPWGSASILPISWMYITMMGYSGLKRATLVSILSANYIAKKLEAAYPVLYKGSEGLVAHECILDLRGIKKTSGVDVTDVAKRLMDYGFHAPTMSWPVAGTLMVEPTESEPKAELDRFIEAMLKIREEITLVEKGTWPLEKSPLVMAPHTVEHVTQTAWDRPYSRETAAYPLAWVKTHKYWPSVGRVDNAYGDRHVVCACPSVTEYQ